MERARRPGRRRAPAALAGWLRLAPAVAPAVAAAFAPLAAQPAVGPALPTLAAPPRTAAAVRRATPCGTSNARAPAPCPTTPARGRTAPATRTSAASATATTGQDADDAPFPPEPVAAARARLDLIARLDGAAAADSADDWIAGQRVRYLLEAGRAADAAAAAAACRGTPWWCRALAGAALHAAGAHAASAAAHDSARALLPDSAARCGWDDLAPWLPPDAARAYRRLPCGSADRGRYEARFWRLAQPFWALPANDLRNELAARRTLARVHAAGRYAQSPSWGADLAESEVRYGAPVAWSVRRPGYGSRLEPSVVGHEPTPSYDFTPDARTLAPALLLRTPPPAAVTGAGTWSLRRPAARTYYAPRYTAFGVDTLAHQIARFRRGDTLLVVAAYAHPTTGAAATRPSEPPAATDAAGSSTRDTSTAERRVAALVLDDSAGRPAAVRVRDGAPGTGTLTAAVLAPPARRDAPRWLASLEVLDTAATTPARRSVRASDAPRWRPPAGPQRGRAARTRAPLVALPPDARLSDLLLVRPGAFGPAPTLAAVSDSAAGAPLVRAGEPFGLYWEQYARATAGPHTIAITATRVGASAWERLGAAVGRAVVAQPVSLRYADPAGGAAGPGRYVALRWPVVPPGTYRLAVRVWADAGAGAADAGAAGADSTALVVRVVR
jgi:hypothetical protein